LLVDGGGLGVGAHVAGRRRAVRLAEGVAAGDQRHGLFVVHRHAREGLADVVRRGHRVGVAVGAFGVHVDQAHLYGGQRVVELAVARIALVAGQPGGLGAPVHVLVGLPHVGAAAGEAEGLEAHRFERHVAGQHDEVGPRELAAVLLLDRPQQPARLVEVDVVGPAVQRREALLAATGAAAPVADAVGAGAVPGHAHEQAAIVAEVGRPPVLRIGHQRLQVGDHGVEVQALEGLGVVEVGAHRVGQRRVLVQRPQVQLLGPPVAVAAGRFGAGAFGERALRFVGHLGFSVGQGRWAKSRSRPAPRANQS